MEGGARGHSLLYSEQNYCTCSIFDLGSCSYYDVWFLFGSRGTIEH